MKNNLGSGMPDLIGVTSLGCNGTSYGICSPILRIFANACPSSRTLLISGIWQARPIPTLPRKRFGVDTNSQLDAGCLRRPRRAANGRELQVFHLANAFLRKRVSMPRTAMCTSSFLKPQTRTLPGSSWKRPWIVNSAVPARMPIPLAKHGFKLDSQHGGELPVALPVQAWDGLRRF